MALVFVAVAVGVADQRRLPVVMDEGVGDGDIVGGVGELLLLVFGLGMGFCFFFFLYSVYSNVRQ